MVEAGAKIMKVCAEVGGSISGEHGIGLENPTSCRHLPPADRPHSAAQECLQSDGLCHPGKVFPTRNPAARRGRSPTAARNRRQASLSVSERERIRPLVALLDTLRATVGGRPRPHRRELSPLWSRGAHRGRGFPGSRRRSPPSSPGRGGRATRSCRGVAYRMAVVLSRPRGRASCSGCAGWPASSSTSRVTSR